MRNKSQPLTADDLATQPNNGNRYELIDGVLYVSPPPPFLHQEVVAQLAFRLNQAKPDDMAVFVAPLPVRLSSATEVAPDVLVAPVADFVRKTLPVAPALAVEVLSLSSVVTDFNAKKRTYERYRVPSYWVIDPVEPRVVVFELDKRGKYRGGREFAGDMPFKALAPFPVRIVPSDLLSGVARRQSSESLWAP